MTIRFFGRSLTVAFAILAAGSLASQENVLEEIIVTAEKREASIQDTALAITAVSGDMLENGGLDEIEDLSLDVPSLVFSRAGGEAQLYIRGVGTNLFGIGQDSSVAVHQDGVYQGRAQMGLNQFLDVERVEVLRGPQGTLYGRNATAGVINVIHREPGDEAEGYVNLKIGNFNRYDAEAAYGGPLGESAGFPAWRCATAPMAASPKTWIRLAATRWTAARPAPCGRRSSSLFPTRSRSN